MAQPVVVHHVVEGVGQRVDVVRVDQHRGATERLGQRPGARGHDRHACSHRLERRQPEALVDRGIGEQAGAGEQVAALAVGDVPEPHDPVAVPGRVPRGVELLGAPAVGAGDDEPQLGVARRDLVEGAHEHGQVLARLDRAERDHVTLGARELPAALRVAAAARANAERDLRDPRVVDPEVLAHLAGHELARRVHDGAAVERPPDEAAVLQRVGRAQLGEADEGQVVDGHDDRAARRRPDERCVHDVDGTGPRLDARYVGAQPQRPDETGGYGTGRGADPGREASGGLVAAAERQRVRDEIDVVSCGESVEEPRGDLADPGRLPQQRRAVDREPQRPRQRSQISSGSCSMPSRSRSTLSAGTPACIWRTSSNAITAAHPRQAMRKLSSTRRNSSTSATDNATSVTAPMAMPITQDTVALAWPINAINACASVSARMNAPLPAASMASSPRLIDLSKKSCTAHGPSTNAPTTPITPTATTISTSLRRPLRKSSYSPAPASRASFGSSAACTAWNRMIGTRARKKPDTNAATAACCASVASTVATRMGA